MKTYSVQFRKSFEVLFHGEVQAKSEEDAEKKLRKFAKSAWPDSDMDDASLYHDVRRLDEGDDFCVWKSEL